MQMCTVTKKATLRPAALPKRTTELNDLASDPTGYLSDHPFLALGRLRYSKYDYIGDRRPASPEPLHVVFNSLPSLTLCNLNGLR